MYTQSQPQLPITYPDPQKKYQASGIEFPRRLRAIIRIDRRDQSISKNGFKLADTIEAICYMKTKSAASSIVLKPPPRTLTGCNRTFNQKTKHLTSIQTPTIVQRPKQKQNVLQQVLPGHYSGRFCLRRYRPDHRRMLISLFLFTRMKL